MESKRDETGSGFRPFLCIGLLAGWGCVELKFPDVDSRQQVFNGSENRETLSFSRGKSDPVRVAGPHVAVGRPSVTVAGGFWPESEGYFLSHYLVIVYGVDLAT